jgi:hypothetical protein
MRPALLISLLTFSGACGEVIPPPDGQTAFVVGGTVSGFAGRNLVLQLNGGDDLTISADGSFSFPAPVQVGTAYTVTVKSQPICPVRRCTLTNATGMIASADASVDVSCEKPKQRLASGNWGEKSIRATDDIAALADNATAVPRILIGANTQIQSSEADSVAYDGQRDILYMASGKMTETYGYGVLVFKNASTLSGNTNYSTRIRVPNETQFFGVEIDPVADRLYVSGYQGVYVLDLASSLSGQVTPVAKLVVEDPTTANAGAITLDPINDRLYIGGDYTSRLYVFDNARMITSASLPTHTVSWPVFNNAGFRGPPAIAVDGCRDRLYLGSTDTSPAGYNMFVFDNASMLDGAINPETQSQAQLRTSGLKAVSAKIDSEGALYYWDDSATKVRINHAPETLAGPLSVMPDKTINAVVASGYGLDVIPYY